MSGRRLSAGEHVAAVQHLLAVEIAGGFQLHFQTGDELVLTPEASLDHPPELHDFILAFFHLPVVF